MKLLKKHNVPKKMDQNRTQRSILSYITVKSKSNPNLNCSDLGIVDSDLSPSPALGDSHTLEVTTPKNVTSEVNVPTPTVDCQESPNSAYIELVTQLENSSDRSLVSSTPQRKRSYFRISGSKDRKRLQLSSDPESPTSQLRKRIKLSQSPRKNSADGNSNPECCNRTSSTPGKENDSGHVNAASKCSPPSARIILQEVTVQSDDSSPKKYSTNDFVDIENLGDFLKEDWGKEFTERENLDLSEWKTCLVTDVKEMNDGFMVELEQYGRKIDFPASTSCFIQGYWGDKKLQCKDVVNIKGYFDDDLKAWRVDHTRGYVVKHPDILISSTCLVSSLFCQRRGVLSYLYPGLDSKNFSMLLGSLIHELLQEVLTQKIYSENEIKSLAIRLINKPRSVLQSYEFGLASVDLEKELLRIVPEIVNFVNTYVFGIEEDKMWPGKIVNVLSTEENFWIPQLGLKGKADFVLDAEKAGETKLMPLELKTGRASNAIEHRAQIILYLMMMSEVGMCSDSGLLLYLKHNILGEVNPRITEKQGLVTTRNNLVDYYVANDSSSLSDGELFTLSLPEPINHHNGCSKCPYLTVCSAHLKNESELVDSNPLKALSASALTHLSSDHIQYVFRWVGLLKLEEIERKKDMVVKVSDMWRMSPEDREKRGYCVSKLTVASVEKREDKFVHRMLRSQNTSFDLTKSGLTEGDYIVVSTESRLALATGYVHSVLTGSIDLKLSRTLDSTSNELFVVDRYSVSETLFAFNTSSLLALLENDDGAARMRRLIIDMELPLFDSVRDGLHGGAVQRSILGELNKYQRAAILKTLTAQDYLLIKGLPGTGKTATIVALVRLLVQYNQTVLITSHTHSAVDNILLRLREHVDFLRLGPSARVHHELRSYCEDYKVENENIRTVEQLELLYNHQSVVAVTCMGCSHSLLSKRKFDYCIVDEATQVLQPSILKSLSSARKFVLVGDPNQLPPVVQSRKASNLGFNESLFVKLDRAQVTSTLYLQYRMNSQIMNLANSFAYNGLLQCDNEDVRSGTIQTSQNSKPVVSWLGDVLSPRIEDSVLFLNTSQLPTNRESSAYANQTEADITFTIIEALSRDVTDIGVIAPYREQVKLVRQMASVRKFNDIEINTVDQYQGRDKDVIIYSCTKYSNDKEGGILADKRRLTVAITRARKKLIIIGNVSVLKKYTVFEELIGLVPKNNLIDVLSI